MLIKKYELKEETVLEIGKFAILWNLFEHDLSMTGAVITAIPEESEKWQIEFPLIRKSRRV